MLIFRFFSRWVFRTCASLACGSAVLVTAGETASVFDGPPATYQASPPLEPGNGILRRITVEERAGVSRTRELVRAPLFFSAGEVSMVDQLELVPAEGGRALPLQFDDIRTGPDGGLSRSHLWFEVDLRLGERKVFHLLRRQVRQAGERPGESIAVRQSEGALSVGTDLGPRVQLEGDKAGRVVGWSLPDGLGLDSPEGLGPRVTITGAKGAGRVQLGTERPKVRWARGPLFLKVVAEWQDEASGAKLEQVYRVHRSGRDVRVTQAVWPGSLPQPTLDERHILRGRLRAPATALTLPAGIREPLRSVHAYTAGGLAGRPNGSGVLVIPTAFGSGAGKVTIDGADITVLGSGRQRWQGDAPAGTLHAFWTELRFIPVPAGSPGEQWKVFRENVHPLVAVVDEPAVSRTQLHDALRKIAAEMKPIGWRQEAGRYHVLGQFDRRDKVLNNSPKVHEADAGWWERAARKSWDALSNGGTRRLREDEKGRAAGPLDPYSHTYTNSASAIFDVLGIGPPRVGQTGASAALAGRAFLGRTAPDGWPYIDCFARTLNMQLGLALFGLVQARAEPARDVGLFYRDLLNAQTVQAVYGRAERPYSAHVATKPDQSDYLYQAISDYWIRVTEILAQEDLGLHPMAFARYTDCIDVMADVYHAFDGKDADGQAPAPRANFFRGQAHTHRWLGWSCAPFIRLLERPDDTTGYTETIHYARALSGRWKNWPDLTYYIIADVVPTELLSRHQPPQLPALPADLQVTPSDGGVRLTWTPVPEAVGYRVYRATSSGGPWTWLNSPYRESRDALIRGHDHVDSEGEKRHHYFVTAVDRNGRESRWFRDKLER